MTSDYLYIMKYKIGAGLLILLASTSGFHYRDQALGWISSSLRPLQKDRVPTWKLRSQDYVVTARAQGELTGVQTTLVSAPRIQTRTLKIAWIEEEGTIAAAGDVVVQFESVETRLSLEENENTFTRYGHEIEKQKETSRSEMEILKMDGQEADLELTYAQNQVRKDENIFSQWEIQESIISAALARYKTGSIERKRELRQHLSQTNLRIKAIQQGKAEAEINLAQHTLSSLEARTPAGGVVLYRRWGLSQLKVGDEVWSGMPIVDIANLRQFQAQIRVSESDISGVEEGDPVKVVLNSFPGHTFPGKIKQVANVAAQISRQDPRKYLLCDVILDVPLEVMEQLKPGIQLVATIELSRRRGVLVVPKSAVIKKDSDFVVFVKRGEEYVEEKVRISGTDYGFYVIEGVEEGVEVCLQHPYDELKLHLPDLSTPPAPTQRPRFVF